MISSGGTSTRLPGASASIWGRGRRLRGPTMVQDVDRQHHIGARFGDQLARFQRQVAGVFLSKITQTSGEADDARPSRYGTT